jgi:hypothetical protein
LISSTFFLHLITICKHYTIKIRHSRGIRTRLGRNAFWSFGEGILEILGIRPLGMEF